MASIGNIGNPLYYWITMTKLSRKKDNAERNNGNDQLSF